MKQVLVINGPNIELPGQQDVEHYGLYTFEDIEALCIDTGRRLGVEVICVQSNYEGEMIDWLHNAGRDVWDGRMHGVVMNPGSYAFTSIALRDAISGARVPLIELHIHNLHAQAARRRSYIAPVARGVIAGLGVPGYALAIDALVRGSRLD